MLMVGAEEHQLSLEYIDSLCMVFDRYRLRSRLCHAQ
jgi:hypothetical protein